MAVRTAFIVALLSAGFARPSDDITEFALASEGHRPQAIAAGPDGNLWVTEVIKHKIVRISPAGEITEFPVPSKTVGVIQGITAGPDGNIWFTSREENMIRRLTPAGAFDGEFKIPSMAADKNSLTPGSWPRVIAPGPDGNLWFAEMAANKIARITPKGEITEFPVPTPDSKPYCVVTGPDKAIWFTESGVDKIGRLDPKTGAVSEFPLPSAKSLAREIVTGSDGNLWFTENTANKIGRIAPDGKITEFPISTKDAQPFCIAAGPDGNMWFTLQANRIARLSLRK
jgi:virginiamycin B lyase